MLRIFVSNRIESFQFDHPEGPLEFGRVQNQDQDVRKGVTRRDLKDDYASAKHLRVLETSANKVRLENLSKRVPITIADGTTIEVGGSCEVSLPARLHVGQTMIEICHLKGSSTDDDALMTIAVPLKSAGLTRAISIDPLAGVPNTEQLTRWFEAVVSVQRSAARSSEFYLEIARAVVELIGMDSGLVLLLDKGGNEWRTVARHSIPNAPETECSRTVLDRVCRERRTFYQSGGSSKTEKSLVGVATVVASPILDSNGESVIGAVYGMKWQGVGNAAASEIRPLHAQLVQVLAATAGAGIARMSSEGLAARRHVQFEQFFGGGLADELDRDPGMLDGRDSEVTVLFSDIRGFSRIAERLGARQTCEMIGDVLERLTARIHEHGGVVVDYIGDGILSMWNAPVAQPDHAARACRTACAMTGDLPELNRQWAGRIGSALALGIGVNTGVALVGNTGSRSRLKYGPLGNTVNLASRVEGATKQLGVKVLITGGTHARLVEPFATRRLCKARVVGIDTPVDLYELHGECADPAWLATRDAYESALGLFEKGQLSEACRALFPLLEDARGRHDTPALTLAARAIEFLRSPSREFDPVVTLDSK